MTRDWELVASDWKSGSWFRLMGSGLWSGFAANLYGGEAATKNLKADYSYFLFTKPHRLNRF